MAENRLKRIAHERQANLFSSLLGMRNEKKMTDVTLVCQNQSFPAHRLVLASGSRYLRKIFQDQKDVTIINVHEVEPDVLSAILEFLYTGELHFPDSTGKRLEMALIVMKNLEVCGLEELIGPLLVNNLNPLNFHYLWKIIRQSKQKDIELEVAKFVMRNLEMCRKSPHFHNLSLQQMMSILSMSNCPDRAPSSILRAIAVWGAHNPKQRDKYVTSLLSVVGLNSEEDRCRAYMNSCLGTNRYTWRPVTIQGTLGETSQELSPKTLRESKTDSVSNGTTKIDGKTPSPVFSMKSRTTYQMKGMKKYIRTSLNDPCSSGTFPEPLRKRKTDQVFASPSNAKLLDKQENYPGDILFCDHNRSVSSPGNMIKKETNSNNSPEKLLIYKAQSSECTNSSKSTETYLVNNGNGDILQESKIKASKRPSSSSHIAKRERNTIRSHILCLAVDRLGQPIKQCYNISDKCWMPAKPMIRIPAINVSILHLDRVLYFVGGETEQQEKLKTVFSYQLDSHYLKQLACLQVGRSEAAITHIGEYIYIIGGKGRLQKSLSEVEIFNPCTNLWKKVASLNVPRNAASATSNSRMIYVAGGYAGENSAPLRCCESYDSKTDQWTTISALSTFFTERGCKIAMCCNHLYALPILKPNKLFKLSSFSKVGEWKEGKKCHSGMIRVIALMASEDSLWVLDRCGKIFQYVPSQEIWKYITELPATMDWPVKAFLIEQKNI